MRIALLSYMHKLEGPLVPVFSVIIPTFNRETLLRRAVDSVLRQDLKSFELIIIDDGSTDSTEIWVNKIMQTDSRVRYLKQKNQGAPSAKNKGIFAAKGQYLGFLDSDDFWMANHLSNREKIYKHEPEVDFIYGQAKVMGNQFVVDHQNPGKLLSLDHPDVKIGGTFTLKTSAAVEIGGFPLRSYSEDFGLFELVVLRGLKIKRTDVVTYCYDRSHEDSITLNHEKRTLALR